MLIGPGMWTKMFWDGTPDDKKIFVADPSQGSRHNRGCAVDLTLYRLGTGQAVAMTGGYDEMSERSYPSYPGGISAQRWRRDVLRKAMESGRFHRLSVRMVALRLQGLAGLSHPQFDVRRAGCSCPSLSFIRRLIDLKYLISFHVLQVLQFAAGPAYVDSGGRSGWAEAEVGSLIAGGKIAG